VLNLGAVAKDPPPAILTADWLREGVMTIVLHIEPLLLNRFKSFVFITDTISYATLRLYTQPTTVEGTSERLSHWIFDYMTDPVGTYVSSHVDAYRNTQVPLYLLWGEEDTLTPITDAMQLLDNRLIILKPLIGVGHIPMLESVEYFNDVLAETLRQL
jgi:pimeloyl-ACP methyl ester carboxylesterase